MPSNPASRLGVIYCPSLLQLTGGPQENSRVKSLNTNAPLGWARSSSDDVNHLGFEILSFKSCLIFHLTSISRALNGTVPSYPYEIQSGIPLVQDGEQISEP